MFRNTKAVIGPWAGSSSAARRKIDAIRSQSVAASTAPAVSAQSSERRESGGPLTAELREDWPHSVAILTGTINTSHEPLSCQRESRDSNAGGTEPSGNLFLFFSRDAYQSTAKGRTRDYKSVRPKRRRRTRGAKFPAIKVIVGTTASHGEKMYRVAPCCASSTTYARISRTTRPWTSVRRKSRPL